MAQTVLITLAIAGSNTGPFDLYSDEDGYVTPFETGVTKVDLLAGYTSILVPDDATIIRVQSDSEDCENYTDLTIQTTTTTTTSTSSTSTTSTTSTSSTTTTTTTIAPLYYVYADYALEVPGASWSIKFYNNVSSSQTFVISGSGTTPLKHITYNDDTMTITVKKLNNGGTSQDAGAMVIYNQTGPTELDRRDFVLGENVANTVFNLSGLSVGDTIYVVLQEG